MDKTRFDNLARQLATGANRRAILKGLFGGAAVVAAGGLTHQSATALHDPNVQCRHQTDIFCNESLGDGHGCCGPNYVCSGGATGNGTCQCGPDYIECGAAPHPAPNTTGHQCIHESHCCTNGVPGCPADKVCHQVDGTYSCVTCQAAGQTCNQFHPCCHPETLVCGAGGTCVSRETECVAVDQKCNKFHPCCHPEAFVCSSTTEVEGHCVPVDGGTVGCTSDRECGGKKICCGQNTDKPGQCVGQGKDEGNRACFKGQNGREARSKRNRGSKGGRSSERRGGSKRRD
jgi:hypothetical protein